jgi:hypothetical protein
MGLANIPMQSILKMYPAPPCRYFVVPYHLRYNMEISEYCAYACKDVRGRCGAAPPVLADKQRSNLHTLAVPTVKPPLGVA